MDTKTAPPSNADDLLWGAAAIARDIKRSRRQTYDLLEKGRIPARKVGKTWVGKSSRIHASLDEGGDVK